MLFFITLIISLLMWPLKGGSNVGRVLRDTEETLINNLLVLAGVGQRNSGALFRGGEGQ